MITRRTLGAYRPALATALLGSAVLVSTAIASTAPDDAATRWQRGEVEAAVHALAQQGAEAGEELAWVAGWELATTDDGAAGLDRYRSFAEREGDDGYRVLTELAEATLRVGLLDPDEEIRGRAIHAIELSGDHRFVEILLDLMEHEASEELRADGAHALRRLGGRDVRVALRRALEHPDIQVQRLAADALARMNDNTARRFLRREARGGDPAQQMWAAGMLVRLEDRSAVPVLEPLTRSPDSSVRIQAVSHLAKISHSSVAPIVRPLLEDPDVHVRFAAATALAELGDPAGIDIIRETARTGPSPSRMRAFSMLAKLDDLESLPILKLALQDKSTLVRDQAATALLTLGDPEGKAYFDEQEEAFGTLGGWAGELLAGSRTSDEDPKAPLDVRAQDIHFENRYTRAETVKKLGRLGSGQIGAIRSVLKDPHPIPRTAALWALAEAGSTVDVHAAIPLLADPVRGLRFDAAGAILKLLEK